MGVLKLVILGLCLFGCSKKEDREPSKPDPRVEILRDKYDSKKAEAEGLRDPNGWLTPYDCDGMLWTGKYGIIDSDGVSIEAAEFSDQPGRFGRRPEPRCWTPESGDVGSKTTWSRDMGIAGLFPYALFGARLDILQRHRDYGESHDWRMGEPLADGRPLYTPAVIGLLHGLIWALGGDDNVLRHTPNVYPKGLEDFQAHLQVMDIFLRGEIGRFRNNTGEISGVMLDRVIEHADREPYNPFYQYMRGLYSGDMSGAIGVLLDPSDPVGSYVRCEELERCELAEWLFSAHLVLREFP